METVKSTLLIMTLTLVQIKVMTHYPAKSNLFAKYEQGIFDKVIQIQFMSHRAPLWGWNHGLKGYEFHNFERA